jgi:cation:H+ antiporter
VPEFGDLSLPANLAVFAAAAAVVWLAGTRIAGYASTLAERTGIGKAVVGALLLGGITSLPEIATTGSAAASGNAALAVNNLLGGVAMQVGILALADAAIGRGALSAIVARPTVLLQATLNILLLALVAIGITAGDVPFLGLGAWTAAIAVVYLAAMVIIGRSQAPEAWRPGRVVAGGAAGETARKAAKETRSTGRVAAYTAVAGAAIFVAGYVLARVGDALAEQTGLGASFVGAVLVAIATSLPEVSSTLAAVRLGHLELAFGDIFGTNLFDVAAVALADAVYAGGPVLREVGPFSVCAALLGMLVTGIYLAGLIERRDRVVLRMGVDSLLVLLVYLGGLALLYRLRP